MTRILERPAETPQAEPRHRRPWHVAVLNCDCHSFDDVILGLMRILGMNYYAAQVMADRIHRTGMAIVATTDRERAEVLADRLHREVVSLYGTLLGTDVLEG